MTKIFNLDACIKFAVEVGHVTDENLEQMKSGWMARCIGKTKEEVQNLRFMTHDSWFI